MADAKQNKVQSLIDSIKSKKGFKQLASYSVQCLAKVITPPHVGWEQNMKEAYEAGALDAISGVIQKHKGDDAVLSSASQCLTSMSQNSEYAGDVVKSGCLMSMFESVVANPDVDSAKETLSLVENVATKTPEALMSCNIVDLCSKYLTKATSSGKFENENVSPVLRTLEQINKLPGGTEQIRENGMIPQLLSNLKYYNTDTSVIEPALRMLDRMCRDESLADYISEKCNGLEQISISLVPHNSSIMVNQVGGRLLSKLSKGNFSGIIDEMDKTQDVARKETLSNLLANLAVEEDNAEKICDSGGLNALVGVFTCSNQGSIISSAKALKRIAQSSPDNIRKLVDSGGISQLLSGLKSQSGNAQTSDAILSTLSSISGESQYAARLAEEENFEVLLHNFMQYPKNVSASKHFLQILDDILLIEDTHTDVLTDQSFLKTLFGVLHSNQDDGELQKVGIQILIYSANSCQAVLDIVENDGTDICLYALTHSTSVPLMKTACFLLTSLCMVEQNYQLFERSGQLETALFAVQKHKGIPEMKNEFNELLGVISREHSLRNTVEKLKDQRETFLVNPSEKSADAFAKLTDELAGFALLAENSRQLVSDTPIVQTLMDTLSSISKARALPNRSDVLSSCARLIEGLADSTEGEGTLNSLLTDQSVTTFIDSLKLHAKVAGFALPMSSVLSRAMANSEWTSYVVENDGIEACIAVLRAHVDDPVILRKVMTAFLTAASGTSGGKVLMDHGATRQIILSLKQHLSNPEVRESVEMMLNCLLHVTSADGGIELLIKQGAVDAVLDVAAVLEPDSVVSKTATEILAKLLTSADAKRGMKELDEILPKLSTLSKSREGVEAIQRIVSRIGNMSSVGSLCDTIIGLDGQSKLQKLMNFAIDDCKVESQQRTILEGTLTATAGMARASKGKVEADYFIPCIVKATEAGLALPQALQCYQGIASQGEEYAIKILENKAAVESITRVADNHMRNPKVSAAFFSTIFALGGSKETRNVISGTSAVHNILKYIDNHSEQATPELMAQALESLSACAENCYNEILTSENIEVLKTVLSRFCADGGKPDAKVFGKLAMTLFAATQGDLEKTAKTVIESGLMKKMIRVCLSPNAQSLINDVEAMESTVQLIGAVAAVEECSGSLQQMQAAAVIFAGMDANGSHQEFLRAAVIALKNLKMGSEMGEMAVRDVNGAAKHLESAVQVNEDDVQRLAAAIENLTKFMLLDGVLTEETAEGILHSLANAVGLLAESELPYDDIISVGINGIAGVVRMIPSVRTSDTIEYVLDTFALKSEVPRICIASLKCLAALSNSTESVIKINESGGFALLESVTQKNVANLDIQNNSRLAATELGESMFQYLDDLVTTGEGIVACGSAILLQKESLQKFKALLDRLNDCPERINILFQVLQRLPEHAHDAYIATCAAIEDALGSDNKMFDISFAQSSLNFALSNMIPYLEASATSTAGESNIAALLRISASLGYSPELEGDLLSQSADVYHSLFEVPNLSVRICSAAFTSMSEQFDDPEGGASRALAYAAAGVPGKILTRLRKLKTEDSDVASKALEVLSYIVSLTGVENSGIQQLAMNQLNALALEVENNSLSTIAKQLVAALREHYGDAAAMITTALSQSNASLESFNIQEAESDPEMFDQFRSTMENVYECISQCEEDEVAAVPSASIKHVIRAMHVGSSRADSTMIMDSMKALKKISSRQDNCIEIAEQGGIAAILEAVRRDPQNEPLVILLAELMERISRNEAYKPVIPEEGGISVAIEICLGIHVNNPVAALKTLSTLANLAFNSTENLEAICSGGGIDAILSAMKYHIGDVALLENATCTLSNLMCGSDDNKRNIGKLCMQQIIEIISNNVKELHLMKMSLRALGNLAYVDENIALAVRVHNAGKVLVNVVEFSRDEQVVQLAIEVLGNFFSFEEAPEQLEQKDYVSLASSLYEQGVGKALLNAMKENKMNSAILKSGIDSLANMCQDQQLTDKFTRDFEVVSMLIQVMQLHDWDMELLQHILPLIATISYSDRTTDLLAENDGISLIVNALEQQLKLLKSMRSGGAVENEEDYEEKSEIVQHAISSCCLILTNVAASDNGRKKIIHDEISVKIVKLAEPFQKEKFFLEELFIAFTRMCSEDDLSAQIADNGMHIIMNAVESFNDDTEFLIVAFRLLGHLAYVESNLKHIVQHDGIVKVMRAVTRHPDNRNLVLRAIQTIDNVAMISDENAMLVVEQGGHDLVKAIAESYADDPDIPQYTRSASISMQQVEKEATFPETKVVNARSKDSSTENGADTSDPLKKHRNMLRAGSVMKVWKKGTPKDAHLHMATDFHSLVWEEPKSRKGLGALDMKKVTRIEQTTGPGHKKKALSRKVAEPNCCFIVETEANTLCCETASPGDAKKWIAALQAVQEVALKTPGKL